MKKFIILMLSLSICVSLAACGGNDTDEDGASHNDSVVSSNASVSNDSSTDLEYAASDEARPEAEDNSESFTGEDSSNEESFVADYSQSVGEPQSGYPSLSDKAYTLYINNNGNGTYTVTAVIPAKVESGKIVVSVSDKLSIVEGSLSTTIAPNAVNEKYDRGGVKGACVVFASTKALSDDAVAFTATYSAKEGATISESDITVPDWNLTTGTEYIGTNKDAEVVIKYVE